MVPRTMNDASRYMYAGTNVERHLCCPPPSVLPFARTISKGDAWFAGSMLLCTRIDCAVQVGASSRVGNCRAILEVPRSFCLPIAEPCVKYVNWWFGPVYKRPCSTRGGLLCLNRLASPHRLRSAETIPPLAVHKQLEESRDGITMATARLAHWAYNLTFADLPPDVVRAAVRSFYNWAGCTIGGSRHEAASIAVSTDPEPLLHVVSVFPGLIPETTNAADTRGLVAAAPAPLKSARHPLPVLRACPRVPAGPLRIGRCPARGAPQRHRQPRPRL